MTPVPAVYPGGSANTSTSAKDVESAKCAVSVINVDPPVWPDAEMPKVHSDIPKFYQCSDEALGKYYLNTAPSSESEYSGELDRKLSMKKPIKNICHRAREFYYGQSAARRILGSLFVPLVVLIIVFIIILVTKEKKYLEYTHL